MMLIYLLLFALSLLLIYGQARGTLIPTIHVLAGK